MLDQSLNLTYKHKHTQKKEKVKSCKYNIKLNRIN